MAGDLETDLGPANCANQIQVNPPALFLLCVRLSWKLDSVSVSRNKKKKKKIRKIHFRVSDLPPFY